MNPLFTSPSASVRRYLVTRDFGTFIRNEIVDVVGQSLSGESALVRHIGEEETELPHPFPWDAMEPECAAFAVIRPGEGI